VAGFTRRRAGRGWVFYDTQGDRISDREVVERCKRLAIPPAYTDVWICPWPNGHLQAIGTDEAGRRQYRYHEQWRADRDAGKHDRVLEVAARLPEARRRVATDLTEGGMGRRRVMATAFRLLDLGLFRVGGESYAQDNGSFGLATLRREHVRVTAAGMEFDYIAKSGKHRQLVIDDAEAAEVLRALKRRRRGQDEGVDEELLAWRDVDGQWHDVTAPTSTPTCTRWWATTCRRRTSERGTARFWPRSHWPATTRNQAATPPGSAGRSRRRCARCRSIWATHRRWPEPPTSTTA